MQLLKIILLLLCIISGGIAFYCYRKVRKLMNAHNDETMDAIMPELQRLTKTLSCSLYALAGILIVHIVVLVIDFCLPFFG